MQGNKLHLDLQRVEECKARESLGMKYSLRALDQGIVVYRSVESTDSPA